MQDVMFDVSEPWKPMPIATAPKDGSVVLTNCGLARYLDQKRWGSFIDHGKWACCDPNGTIFECADSGHILCEPELWMPVPQWIKD